MAGFDFDKASEFVQDTDNKIQFLKLADDGWYAKVRFMYGAGEIFRGETVHNVSEDPKRPKYVSCLREAGQPIESCPLCASGAKVAIQFYVPVYVQSIVEVVRGMETERPVGQVMIFQKGASFKGSIQSVLRQTASTGKPIVSTLFRLVREGKSNDPQTKYCVEMIGTDNVTLEQLPPRPEVVGSYILPKYTAQEITNKFINKTDVAPQQATMSAGIQPRTLNTSTFAGNTVNQPTQTTFQPINNQAPVQAPPIGVTGSNIPF